MTDPPPELGELMLTETIDLPVRAPDRPGRRITWTEHPADSGPTYTRHGYVLEAAPWPDSVWVIPDERRDGEGAAVVIYNTDGAAGERYLGGISDLPSTAQWQHQQLSQLNHPPSN